MNIEIERRYKVTDVAQMIEHLAKNNIQCTKQQRVVDMWFAPEKVQSHSQQHQWFDEEHGVAYRLRTVEQNEGSSTVSLETKQLTSDNNHNSFHETVVDAVSTREEALEYVSKMNYWNWLTIDKTRYHFQAQNPNLEVVLDEIAGLAEKIGVGAALEIEYKGDDDRDTALQLIDSLASDLGLSADQLFEKSLTVESMSELAKFK